MKRLIRVKGLVAMMAAASLMACLDVSGPGASDPATETFATSLNIGNLSDATVWKRGPNGTYFRDEAVGTGTELFINDPQDSIWVDYSGWVKDGRLFDSNTNAQLAPRDLIIGFMDGMVGMRIGGTRTVVIPSNLGFGPTRKGIIDPNSTLIFRIKLIRFSGASS
jgi:FKBP-type peptidyl-prolyl cis-trans isomerase